MKMVTTVMTVMFLMVALVQTKAGAVEVNQLARERQFIQVLEINKFNDWKLWKEKYEQLGWPLSVFRAVIASRNGKPNTEQFFTRIGSGSCPNGLLVPVPEPYVVATVKSYGHPALPPLDKYGHLRALALPPNNEGKVEARRLGEYVTALIKESEGLRQARHERAVTEAIKQKRIELATAEEALRVATIRNREREAELRAREENLAAKEKVFEQKRAEEKREREQALGPVILGSSNSIFDEPVTKIALMVTFIIFLWRVWLRKRKMTKTLAERNQELDSLWREVNDLRIMAYDTGLIPVFPKLDERPPPPRSCLIEELPLPLPPDDAVDREAPSG